MWPSALVGDAAPRRKEGKWESGALDTLKL
jgi:hypothetical protein